MWCGVDMVLMFAILCKLYGKKTQSKHWNLNNRRKDLLEVVWIMTCGLQSAM